jgi:hypothetical protein
MMDTEDLKLLSETDPEMIYHVYPTNDIREHVVRNSHHQPPCWCDPELQIEGMGVVLVHNSADGREAFETGERKLS